MSMFNPQLKSSTNTYPSIRRQHLGAEWVLIRVETLHGMMKEVEKVLGTGASLVWYMAGKGAGKSLIKTMRKELETKDLRKICNFLISFYESCGWGRGEITSWHPGKGKLTLQIWDNAFAEKNSSNISSCYFLKGFIEGVLEELIGRNVKAEELKCISKGDGYCEFVISVNVE